MNDASSAEDQREDIDWSKRREDLMQGLMKIVQGNLLEILDVFLRQKSVFPVNEVIVSFLRHISKEKVHVLKSFNHLTDIMNNPEHLSENVNNLLMNATLFIGCMMETKSEVLAVLTKKFYPQIFATFLLRIATAYSQNVGTAKSILEDPMKQTVWAFEKFIQCCHDRELVQVFEGAGLLKRLASEDYDEGIAEMIHLYCKQFNFEQVRLLFDFLTPFLSKTLDSQKLATIVTVSQLLSSSIYIRDIFHHFNSSPHNLDAAQTGSQFKSFQQWNEALLEILFEHVLDKNDQVRKHVFKGFGNLALLLRTRESEATQQEDSPMKAGAEEEKSIEPAGKQIFSLGNMSNESVLKDFVISEEKSKGIMQALFSGMKDDSRLCAREALSALQKLIDLLDSASVRPFVLNLLQNLRGSFERPDAIVRMIAFNLFGKLSSFLDKSAANFKNLLDNVHYNMVSLVLHTQDDTNAVRQACIGAIQKLTPFLEINLPSETTGVASAGLFDANDQLLIAIGEMIVKRYPDKFNDYLSSLSDFCASPEESIKGACGFLICVMIAKSNAPITKFDERILESLSGLSNEKSSSVKMRLMKGYTLFDLKTQGLI
jgi:hypothetical protein